MDRHCPVCHVNLSQELLPGFTLDYCRACGGVWFDEGEFNSLLSLRSESLSQWMIPVAQSGHLPTATSVWRHCPGCSALLTRHHRSSPPVLDAYSCSLCNGIWVDGEAMHGLPMETNPPLPAFRLSEEDTRVQLALAQIEMDERIRHVKAIGEFWRSMNPRNRWIGRNFPYEG
jgi:Zn-finger nucleic acid-binding protein